MRTFRIVLAIGLGFIASGCAGTTADDATIGQNAGALGYAATPTPPAPKEKRIVRLDDSRRGCGPVAGAGGSWSGAALTTPFGPSPLFCTFEWTPSLANVPPDDDALWEIAKHDTRRKRRYLIADKRSSNTPATFQPFDSDLGLTVRGGGSSSGGGGSIALAGSTFASGGTTAQSGTPPVLTGINHDPGPQPTCEVCVSSIEEADFDDYLFFVLPPEATGSPALKLETDSGQVELGPITSQVFYTPMLPVYSGWYGVTW